ncbi:MAG TPA: YhcH/YjgK/YiaL family protein [Prolixibacteraceae bacterium]
MILDSLKNSGRYLHIKKGITDALQYILSNDLSLVEPGRYEIDGNRLVMIVFEYENTNLDECRMEGHHRYIDLQYWVSGSELMGHEILDSQPVLEEYSDEKDCAFYCCIASYSRLLPGMFVIYYPSDLHTALSDPLSDERVKKVVFKIAVED